MFWQRERAEKRVAKHQSERYESLQKRDIRVQAGTKSFEVSLRQATQKG